MLLWDRGQICRSLLKGFVWTAMTMTGNFFQGTVNYLLTGEFRFSLWYIFLFALCWSLLVDAGFANFEGELERAVLTFVPVILTIFSLFLFLSENGKYRIPHAFEASLVILLLGWITKTYFIYRRL